MRPYKFIKLAHHGSHNGIDDDVRAEWQATKLFAISGGSNDPTHPARDVLTLLKNERATITWARTDKNGRVEARPASTTEPLRIAKGSLNNSTANPRPPRRTDEGVAVGPTETVASQPVATSAATDGVIELTTRIPTHLRPVVITVESEPHAAAARPVIAPRPRPEPGPFPGPGPTPGPEPGPIIRTGGRVSPDATLLGAGHPLPPLLFASNRKTLRDNIGRSEADEAIALIERAGQAYVDVTDSARAIDLVRPRITNEHRGVVLLGGYDVLPAQRLDTLPPQVRTDLGHRVLKDHDTFIVWSDALYGDRDGDGLPEIPVSRIPDGKSSVLVLNALRARGVTLSAER